MGEPVAAVVLVQAGVGAPGVEAKPGASGVRGLFGCPVEHLAAEVVTGRVTTDDHAVAVTHELAVRSPRLDQSFIYQERAVAMQLLRHADFAITMEIYTKVSSKQMREALKRLGESLDR